MPHPKTYRLFFKGYDKEASLVEAINMTDSVTNINQVIVCQVKIQNWFPLKNYSIIFIK